MASSEFVSGDTLVRVTYDPTAILHRASPPGCYRASVSSAASSDGDPKSVRLFIGVVPRLAAAPGARSALAEIAATALLYVAGDDPLLAFERNEAGLPVLAPKLSRRSA